MLGQRLRAIATVCVAMLMATFGTTAAFAGGGSGNVECDKGNSKPGCNVDAGSDGDKDRNSGGQGGNGGGAGGQDGSGGDANCTYEPANPSAEIVAGLGGQPSGEGGWYFKTCVSPDGTVATFPGPIWVPGAAPVASPEVLARQARARLRLPSVAIRLNPSGDQLVNLPTWLALDPASWQSATATAAVPGVSVTATARPTKAEWSLGDGNWVTCTGPGSVWQQGMDPMRSSPDCGYTYRRSSADAPGAAYTVRVTVTWEVTWAGAGRAGTVPGLTTTGTVATRVAESQAIITR